MDKFLHALTETENGLVGKSAKKNLFKGLKSLIALLVSLAVSVPVWSGSEVLLGEQLYVWMPETGLEIDVLYLFLNVALFNVPLVRISVRKSFF